jgi:hypothetical protein
MKRPIAVHFIGRPWLKAFFCKRLVLVTISLWIFIQNTYSQQWVRTFTNGMLTDVRCILESYDKGYLFIDNYAGSMTWIIKTDINGYQLWNKKIGDGQHGLLSGNIEQTLDFGFIIGGEMDKYDPTGYSDPMIMKFNSCGELEWCKVISTPGIYDYADQVKQTPDGQYVMLTSYSDPNNNNRIQLYKLNSVGDLLWKNNYLPPTGAFDDDGTDLLILNDGYLVSGTCYYPDPGQPGGYERPYFFKTDTAGNVLWKLVYGSVNNFHGYSGVYPTITSSSGNLYNVATHSNNCDTPALIKCLELGDESYYQDLYPQSCPGGAGPINFVSDTNLVVLVEGTVNGQYKIKWIKTDTLGNEFFEKSFSSTWMGETNCSIITFDKKIISLSYSALIIYLYKLNQHFDYDSIYSHPYTYDSLCSHPIYSDTINPDCGLIVNVNEPYTNPETTWLKVFPNPASDKLTLVFPQYLKIPDNADPIKTATIYHQWKSTTLEVYNLNGEMIVKKEILKSQTKIVMEVSTWPKGMYFFRLVYNKQTVISEKVILN